MKRQSLKNFLLSIWIIANAITSISAETVTVNGITLTPSLNSTTLTLRVQGNNSGYIGFGFGSDMNNVDVIMLYHDGSNVIAYDGYATSQTTPGTDVSLSATNNVSASGTYSSGNWDVTLTRPIAASDPSRDTEIKTTGTQPFAVALGSSMSLTQQHSSVKVVQMNFQSSFGYVLEMIIPLSILAICIAW